jgi:hypothetical protein
MKDKTNPLLLTPLAQVVKKNGDIELEEIFQAMLDIDEDITARGAIRRHSTLRAASSIIRDKSRSDLIQKYKEKQSALRSWRVRVGKKSKDSMASDLAEKDIKISQLERQVELLTSSHLAMIRAVGELGGMSKWINFYKGYESVLGELIKMGAMSKTTVVELEFKKN